MTETSLPSDGAAEHTGPPPGKHSKLAWLGLALSALGGISYFAVIGGLLMRVSAVPFAIVSAIGLVLTTVAIVKRRSKLTIATAIPSYLVGVGFLLSVFVLMKLPQAQQGLAVGNAPPPLTLPDQDSQSVSLADFRGKGPVLLVFYRGHW